MYWIHFQNIYTCTCQNTLLDTLSFFVFKVFKCLQCIFKQGHLEIPAFKADCNYCRISPRYFEHLNRFSFHNKDFLEWKLSQLVFKRYLPENGDPSDRSVCFQIIQSNSKRFCLETRPTQFSYECNGKKNQEILYAFSTFSSIQRVLCKIAKAKVNTQILITPAWQNSTLVCKSSYNVIFSTFSTPNVSRRSKVPKRGDHPLVINKSLALVASKITEKPWLSQAFHNKVLILTLTQRGKVQQLITTPTKKGSCWCYRKQNDPFQCPINYVLRFCACLYEARYVCRLINLGFAHRATFWSLLSVN